MHIDQTMFGYGNAGWQAPSTQTGAVAQFAGCGDADSGADGSAGGASAAGASGANPILQALAAALQSLGLSLTSNAPAQAVSGAAAAPASSSAAAASGVTGGPVSDPASSSTAAGAPGVHTIARDIRHVMRALFTDIQAESELAPASTGAAGSSPTPQASFGSGLAALISQIQGGSVPANLQNAFAKLVSDLEKIGGGSAASGAPVSPSATTAAVSTAAPSPVSAAASPAPAAPATTAASATASASPPSATASAADGTSYQGLLLQFLTNLQSDLGLGYGASAPGQGATSGLMVNALA